MLIENRPLGPGFLLCCLTGRYRGMQGRIWAKPRAMSPWWDQGFFFNVLSVLTTTNPRKSKLKFFLPTWMLYINHKMHVQKMTPEWVRFNRTDGSSVKSTGCSSCRPRFNSQHPCSSTQLSSCSSSRGSNTFTQTYVQAKQQHTGNKNRLFF